MGLSSAIDWWDEWKLRILVLCSLFVQFVLVSSRIVRQWYILRRLRIMVWLAYIAGDALAVYALAILFNRQKQQQADGSALEVIWAPVLLIHLGGQPFISAYSLEDNELWKRHTITLVSQVTVALYVFCKWWSGATRLLQAAVLLFVLGILRFAQKPWALRKASYGNMTSIIRVGEIEEATTNTNYSLEEYVRKAQEHVKQERKGSSRAQPEKFNLFKFKEDEKAQIWTQDIHKMFLDLSAPYSIRLHHLQSFLNLDGPNRQHQMLWRWIYFQFLAIYTKVRSMGGRLFFCTVFLLPSLPLASLVLFAKSDKDGYDKTDITVTYILFWGTVVMELSPLIILSLFVLPSNHLTNKLSQGLDWLDMVAQHNIMSFCARKRKPPALMKLATFSFLRDYINKHWYNRHRCEAQQISVLVHRHAEYGWKEYIHDPATYRRFNNLRGEHTLWKHGLLDQDKLGWTFNLPFDEYVLLWHLATDLCLHHASTNTNTTTTASSSSQSQEDTIKSRRSNSEIISNYMIYLLFICPDMLMPGTRSDLFMLACDEIESMIKDESPSSLLDETRSGIAQWVLGMGQGDQRLTKAPKVSDALHKLARVLIDDLNEEQRWKVIQGVWVEMLCYSASRCRGYLHAKSLGHHPEFLTNAWLLWWCMGMQTLPDMVNNLGPPEELTAAAAASV